MEVKVTKKQMKEMIKKYYGQLGGRDISIRVKSGKEILGLLERDYSKGGLDYCITHTIVVTGRIENEGVLHDFSEELEESKVIDIVKAHFDEEKYCIREVEFDDGFRPSLFSAGSIVVPYCKGMIVTVDQKQVKVGMYIVKK